MGYSPVNYAEKVAILPLAVVSRKVLVPVHDKFGRRGGDKLSRRRHLLFSISVRSSEYRFRTDEMSQGVCVWTPRGWG